MAKVRVYELAKDLGLESKELLAKLQEVGEFVRSASSTIEAPVVRKLMEKFPDMKTAAEAASAAPKKPAAKKAAAKKAEPTQEEIDAAIAQLDESTRNQLGISAGSTGPVPSAPKPGIPAAPQAPEGSATPDAPAAPSVPGVPSPTAFATPRPPAPPATPGSPAMPRPPRAGNNPFSAQIGGAIPRPPVQRPLQGPTPLKPPWQYIGNTITRPSHEARL